ncbi:hypothetical protein THASP1DRAFT_27675 [Thamnocephalis sphaerospora]|uniref:Uncharacterized protein n=1 Tax=Thamnocephalis sphaerospora TaxID=78915 RepID=A0A4P9XXY3_9FUNG|nr:hypothetical protein THASP1DRAFT_27675 [Thamnocephalis sphaerospora]|eukprot:RKP10541.1 hypothetical protein THASP1DRAFT_27675 [Thamnocephalis sphaerospora]
MPEMQYWLRIRPDTRVSINLDALRICSEKHRFSWRRTKSRIQDDICYRIDELKHKPIKDDGNYIAKFLFQMMNAIRGQEVLLYGKDAPFSDNPGYGRMMKLDSRALVQATAAYPNQVDLVRERALVGYVEGELYFEYHIDVMKRITKLTSLFAKSS